MRRYTFIFEFLLDTICFSHGFVSIFNRRIFIRILFETLTFLSNRTCVHFDCLIFSIIVQCFKLFIRYSLSLAWTCQSFCRYIFIHLDFISGFTLEFLNFDFLISFIVGQYCRLLTNIACFLPRIYRSFYFACI